MTRVSMKRRQDKASWYWRVAYSVLEEYGDVHPAKIEMVLIQRLTRRRCSRKKDYKQVMRRVRTIREEHQEPITLPVSCAVGGEGHATRNAGEDTRRLQEGNTSAAHK